MDLLTVKEAGIIWGITARMVTIYCETGRIPGAFKKGNLWLIPGDAVKPIDRIVYEILKQLISLFVFINSIVRGDLNNG